MKNLTRLASLMGTWSAETHLSSHYHGGFEYANVRAYIVLHLMPDPMRILGCKGDEASSCNELDNQLCLRRQVADNTDINLCVDTEEVLVEWSDVIAYWAFGVQAKSGAASDASDELQKTTRGWIGPYNVVLAQDTSSEGMNDTRLVDKYEARYVVTPNTKFLQPTASASIISFEDFPSYAGSEAVNETVKRQTRLDSDQDPYGIFSGTCENGNVSPVLPLFDFRFLERMNCSEAMDCREKLQAHLNYKIMVTSRQDSLERSILSKVKTAFEKHVSGPYCHDNDPNGSWTFDFDVTTMDRPIEKEEDYDEKVKFARGCLEGLPCIPPPAMLNNASQRVVDRRCDSPSDSTDLHKTLITYICYALSVAFLVTLVSNIQLRIRHGYVLERLHVIHEDEIIAAASGRSARIERAPDRNEHVSPFGDMEHSDETESGTLREPLLPGEDDDVLGSQDRRGDDGTSDEEGA